jgi:micrococcal nuclease
MASRRSHVPKNLRSLFPYLNRPGTPGFWLAWLIVIILLWQLFRAEQGSGPPSPSAHRDSSSEQGSHDFVKRVVDGDTLVMGNETRIRLIGVNTPETKAPNTPVEPFGPEATEFTKNHVEGKTVRLEPEKRQKDRYGRELAFVYLDGWFLNEELIRAGLARAELGYSFAKAMKEKFRAAEAEAKAARRGIWSLE